MQPTRSTGPVLFGILLLFLIQSLTDFIQSIYSFGLLVTSFTVEVASIVLLFTPLVLMLMRRPPSRGFLIAAAYTAILARLLEPMLDPGGRLVASGISVGAFMLLFPALLYGRSSLRGWDVAGGLALATSASVFLRTAGSGLDLSEQGMFQLISWALGLLAAFLFGQRDWMAYPAPDQAQAIPSGGGITPMATGLAAAVLMIYFAISSPAVIARWTGFSYPAILLALAAGLLLFSLLLSAKQFFARLDRRILIAWNALFLLSLVLTILPHQVPLPMDPGLYPIVAPDAPPWAGAPLFLMLLLSPVIFIDFMFFARQITLERPSLRQLGGSFALAALFFLVMVFFHVFTTIYDYAPVVGPLFRNRFWLVYLLAGLGLALPALLLRREAFGMRAGPAPAFLPIATAGLAMLIALAGLAKLIPAAIPLPAPVEGRPLKVMTYNIQQGFDKLGSQGLQEQLAVIRAEDPDILGLQESDTARIANGNADAVRFFADNLDMYSYYGPTTTTGTFGIALLSKYPIENARTFFMFSEAEQTATIQAKIRYQGKTYNVFVTHLGNGGPMVQLENILFRLQGLENVIIMGDFNFRPATEQYALITQSLQDSWLLKWPGGKEIPGYAPDRRIDHIFVSPGTEVVESEYQVHPASDHPYMWTNIEP